MSQLYDQPIRSARTGPLFNAFSYPTKIDPETIAVFIAAHTVPGQTVLDVFGGSGTTGIAAALCDQPTTRMRRMASAASVETAWGPRNAIIYELSPIGVMIGDVLTHAPDPTEFTDLANQLLDQAEREIGHLYIATSPAGVPGRIRHIVWSESIITACCQQEITLFDAAVRLNPARFQSNFYCPSCGRRIATADCQRKLEETIDPFTGNRVTQRQRTPVRVYGTSGSTNWSRNVNADDLQTIARIPTPPADWVPQDEIEWGDLYRSGYHTGLKRIHQFYTPRNLAVMARLWALSADISKGEIREALRFWILSYNASHSTLMTRVVAKQSQRDLVVTGAQSGVLYVSGLPVEKNVLLGLRRKLATLGKAFSLTRESNSTVEFRCGSSTCLDLENDSVDYVFTDPPFGDYIPYAELNCINESWLRRRTNRFQEAIVSPAQGKSILDYGQMMGEVFAEVARVLNAAGCATVVFHASKSAIWRALGSAFRSSGLSIARTSILDKGQSSFKQSVSDGGTSDDAVFLLKPDRSTLACGDIARSPNGSHQVAESVLWDELRVRWKRDEVDERRLWATYASRCLEHNIDVEVGAPEFYRILRSERVGTSDLADCYHGSDS